MSDADEAITKSHVGVGGALFGLISGSAILGEDANRNGELEVADVDE